jgi:hypothetical protein
MNLSQLERVKTELKRRRYAKKKVDGKTVIKWIGIKINKTNFESE